MAQLPLRKGSLVSQALSDARNKNNTQLISVLDTSLNVMLQEVNKIYNKGKTTNRGAEATRNEVLTYLAHLDSVWETQKVSVENALKEFDLNKNEIDVWLTCTTAMDDLSETKG